uniref:JAB domain-containing protein n=1 Tax=candidate division WOR-3 bacterium TaxID=2052148 RepID=A0A7C4TCV5_UNCW3
MKKIEVKNSQGNKDPIEAYLNLPAFLAIVSASIEAFKKETLGYLIGVKGENKFIVEYAIPYQTAESGFAHVEIDIKRMERVNEILHQLSEGLEYIGDFHSHTIFGNTRAKIVPSDEDLLTSVAGELNIICAVNTKGRSVKWYENKRGTLVGTISDYRIEIGGFYVPRPVIGRKYKRVKVRCPAITGIKS